MHKGIAKASAFFESIKPSCIRNAQILFEKRTEQEKERGEKVTIAINTAIGNVSLKTHPKMLERYLNPTDKELKNGIWRYCNTQGRELCNKVFINIVRSFLKEDNNPEIYSLIDAGGSNIMKVVMLGICGNPGTSDKPFLIVDPTYTNYKSIGEETGRSVIAITRVLQKNEKFTDVPAETVEKAIKKYKPGGLLIIPYDNPSGQLMRQETINKYAKICVENGIFLISDEAYRGLHYTDDPAPTIWNITNKEVPNIEEAKIRISIETMSKVFNACGLRMGALLTDNEYFYNKAIAANTTYLCPSVVDQHIVEALAEESKEKIQNWISQQRKYYRGILKKLYDNFHKVLPDIIVSLPEASIYSVIDVRNIAKTDFNAEDFITFCATEGSVSIDGRKMTLLVSPMGGFYNPKTEERNPGATQMRIACVLEEEEMDLVPKLFVELFKQYESQKT